MAEYIERKTFLAELQEEIDFETPMYTAEQNEYFKRGLKCAFRDAKRQPLADVVAVRHGEWILSNTNPYGCQNIKNRTQKICSCCGWMNACRYAYCPNCGAKMDGKGDGE